MNFCQLCGSGDDVSLLEEEFLSVVQRTCEMNLDTSALACMECNIFLYQIQVFARKAQSVNEMLVEIGDSKTSQEINQIRSRYGLPELNLDEVLIVSKSDEFEDLGDSYIEEIYEEDEEEDVTLNDSATEDIINSSENNTSKETAIKLCGKSLKESLNDVEKNDDERLFSFKCHVCDAPEFKKMFQLSAHTRSEHDCLPMVKCFCDKHLSTMRGLERHRAKHFPRDSDIRCTKCVRSFKTQRGLENHYEKSHGPNKMSFICSQCGRSFCERKVLERHEITHELPSELRRKFECSECEKRFISSEARQCHYAKHHEQILSFFCDVCSKGFYTRKSLNSHVETHKPNESVICDLCNGTFKSLKYMQKHRRSHFLPPQSSFFVCDVCNKQFRKKSQMKNHMLVHSDVAEHSCNICLRSFKKKAYLKTHIVTHTGERKFRCMFCDRTFADSGNCRKHKLRDHAEEIAEHESKHGKKGISNALFFVA